MMKKLKFPIKVLLFSMVFPAFLSTQILAKEPPETILKSLPAKIGTFVAENPVSYENKELGASIGYNDSEGTALTLYLYDLGVEKIEEGITSPVVNMAREMAMKDLQTVAGQGYYRNIKLLSDGVAAFDLASSGTLKTLFTSFSYEIVTSPGAAQSLSVLSDLYLAGLKDYICKVRITRLAIENKEKEMEIKEVLRVLLSDIKK